MLPYPLVLLPLTAASSLKAISYGEAKSAETLFQSLTPVSTNVFRLPDIHHSVLPEPTTIANVFLPVRSEVSEEFNASLGLEALKIFDDDEDYEEEYDLHLLEALEQASAAVQGPHNLYERQARIVPMDAGVMQIDCLQAPDICKNAGYYQNCIRGASGNINTVTYLNGPYDKNYANANRKQSGVRLSGSTPCNGWPFVQRFWHPQTGGLSTPAIQTNEWPMASFRNNPFSPTAPPVALRCMLYSQNSAGATAWTNFRNCEGEYDPNPKSSGFNTWQGKYAYGTRNGPCRPLIVDDLFRVNFNFSSFDPNNQAHNTLRRVSGETRDIEQYHVFITATGQNLDNTQVEIRTWFNSDWNVLARKTADLPVGGSFVVPSSATLPLPFNISRTNCRYEFDYGNLQTDGVRWFRFNSQNTGWEKAPDKKSLRATGQYCGTQDIPRGHPRSVGKTTECSFPGW